MAAIQKYKYTYGFGVLKLKRTQNLSICSVWKFHFATFGTLFDTLDTIFDIPGANSTTQGSPGKANMTSRCPNLKKGIPNAPKMNAGGHLLAPQIVKMDTR
jgi:hypothetical protein